MAVDLTNDELPQPRLKVKDGVVMVPAFTDFKLHDITAGTGDPNREANRKPVLVAVPVVLGHMVSKNDVTSAENSGQLKELCTWAKEKDSLAA